MDMPATLMPEREVLAIMAMRCSTDVILAVVSSLVMGARPSAAAHNVGITSVSPTVVVIGTTTVVTITAAIPDPALITGSVNLLRLDNRGQVAATLGTLRDNGLNGDIYAGDHIYTLRVALNETEATEIPLQLSAAFRGTPIRARVTLPSVFVQPASAVKDTLATIASELESGDMASVTQAFSQVKANLDTLNSLDDQDRKRLAAGMRNATCSAINVDLQKCAVSWTQSDGAVTPVDFLLTPIGGHWIIISW